MVAHRPRPRGLNVKANGSTDERNPGNQATGQERGAVQEPRAALYQCETVSGAGFNGAHVPQKGQRVGQGSPGGERAVSFEGQTAATSGRNGNDIAQSGWHSSLTRSVVAPGHHSAIGLQGKAMARTRRDSHCVC